MLIEDGYMHSLHALMLKIRANETAVTGRNRSSPLASRMQSGSLIDWIVQMWKSSRQRQSHC